MGVKDVAQINGLTLGEGRLLKLLVRDDNVIATIYILICTDFHYIATIYMELNVQSCDNFLILHNQFRFLLFFALVFDIWWYELLIGQVAKETNIKTPSVLTLVNYNGLHQGVLFSFQIGARLSQVHLQYDTVGTQYNKYCIYDQANC